MATQSSSPAIPASSLLVGSIWRKWDLHLHAPSSVFNNQFPKSHGLPDWAAYIAKLASLTDIAVLGVTDYFSIEGYKRVREAQKQGKLDNISLILPNIELRLTMMVPTSSSGDNAKVKKVNAHVLFSPDVDPVDIEEHFLRELKFSAIGVPQAETESWPLHDYHLEQFGTKLKSEHNFQGSPYEVGCRNAAVEFNRVKEILANRRSIFERRYLVFMATENTSLISWDGQGHTIRKVLLAGSDGVFGTPSERPWYLGKMHPKPEDFAKEFASLKPCVQGSDAHSLEAIGQPINGKFCWVKADPTFEGLRQVVFEPEERIYLGDQPPLLKHPFHVIKSIEITSAPDWFSYAPLPFNPDLVAIIGGKGAGKSALAELIAYAGGSTFFKGQKPRDLQDSFLAKASKKSPSNLRTILGATAKLYWLDGSTSHAIVNEALNHGIEDERVKYLPQKFVERICSPENDDDLIKEVERVIFHRIKRVDRLGASSFADLRELKTKSVQVKKASLAETLLELNREVFTAFERYDTREEKRKSLAASRKELAELTKHRPDTTSVSIADLDQLRILQERLKLQEAKDSDYRLVITAIEETRARFETMQSRITIYNSEISVLLKKAGIDENLPNLRLEMPTGLLWALTAREKEVTLAVAALRDGPDDGENISAITKAIRILSEKLQMTNARKLEFEKYEKDRQALEELVEALDKDITFIEGTLKEELFQKRQERLERYLDYFAILQEEKTALDELYAPLQTALADGGETDRKLQFNSQISFATEAHAATGCELFDNRKKGKFKDKDLLVAELQKLMNELESASFDRDYSRQKLQTFRDNFLVDTEEKALDLKDQLKRNKTEEDFNNWFYDLKPYSVKYSVTFEGRSLSLLSPGQKGIVLLLVYLEVDQDDQRPLIIDQPEDNLDNLSVYANLIQFFRKRKQTRQIILITHNPNLVVNTDAEQIVVAIYQGDHLPRIAYRSGALEESRKNPPGIREQVCAILEGGTEAFQRREEKYSLA